MLFNSLDFAIFLPIVLFLYWKVPYRRQVLLVSSYLFYGFWNYKFLILIFLSSVLDYGIALKISKTEVNNTKKRTIWLAVSLLFNLSVLIYFKYFNFFVEAFCEAFKWFGFSFSYESIAIILPVGISFYTFQTLSYTIDVYRNKIVADKSLLNFLCFVSFFPQLVAGPIEKATDLLPQFSSRKKLTPKLISEGLRQILWGLFQKVVIADNAATFVNYIFENYDTLNGITLFFGLFLFSIQIYCDFSGYSHIAIGVAKLFDFKLKQNFALPYFSRNFHEFWKRWHISLTNWFRTYLYTSLGGNRYGKIKTLRNVWVVFLISGLWHGAHQTFVLWGAIHALLYTPFVFRKKENNYLASIISFDSPTLIKEFLGLCLTNIALCFTWLFFRAKDTQTAFQYLRRLGTHLFEKNIVLPELQISPLAMFLLIVVLLGVEWQSKLKAYPLENIELKYNTFKRYSFYYLIIGAIFWFGAPSQEFVYFQF